jgi:response regulator NasT
MVEQLRVLIADDETVVRLDLRGMLEADGFKVCGEATDGAQAVTLARELAPDLAIMDVKMAQVDGVEAAERILAERRFPIVMLTGYDDEALVDRAVSAGVFGYVLKPFREQDMRTVIHVARARHAEVQALTEFRDRVEAADAGKLYPSYMRW